MKILPFFLISAVAAASAVIVHDQLRPEKKADPPPASAGFRDALDSLAARVKKAEDAILRLSVPDEEVVDDALLARLERLERRLAAAPEGGALAVEAPAASAEGRDTDVLPKADGEPTPEAIERFRKLAAATRKQERVKRDERVVNATLERLGLTLREDRRERLVRAWGAFQRRRDRIWGEAKRRGAEQGESVNWGRIIRDTNAIIVREFADSISGFINASAAEAISRTLNPHK